jgi:hypothetical protein
MTKLDALAALARKATQPWFEEKPRIARTRNLDYIAALDPQTVLALIECVHTASDIREHMAKVSTCKCGGNACGWCRKVNAYDTARAKLEQS